MTGLDDDGIGYTAEPTERTSLLVDPSKKVGVLGTAEPPLYTGNIDDELAIDIARREGELSEDEHTRLRNLVNKQ